MLSSLKYYTICCEIPQVPCSIVGSLRDRERAALGGGQELRVVGSESVLVLIVCG